jgi:cytochrome P450
VGINNWVYHRNEAIFGEDADEFKPERWLTSDSEQLSIMNKNLISVRAFLIFVNPFSADSWLLQFGAGARTCIGRHIAALQMSKLVPRLVKDFDFTLCDDISEPGHQWNTKNYFFLKPTNFRVSVRAKV